MVLRGLERLAAPPHLNGQRLAGYAEIGITAFQLSAAAPLG